ncbi:MAG: MerC domain-containing protein [Sphingobacteriales bacterium]|nr:MAG: MerC domain-containing protein [Sphingobacteriales bacterium]
MPIKYKTKNYDLLGVSAALLCLVHCLLFPLLFFIPLGISHNPYIDLLFLTLGVWSVYKTSKGSKYASVKYLLGTGILLITISVGMDMLWHWHSPLMYIGAIALIAGHLINLKAHHKPESNAAGQPIQEEAPYEQKY